MSGFSNSKIPYFEICTARVIEIKQNHADLWLSAAEKWMKQTFRKSNLNKHLSKSFLMVQTSLCHFSLISGLAWGSMI